jgi:predicted secreted protein
MTQSPPFAAGVSKENMQPETSETLSTKAGLTEQGGVMRTKLGAPVRIRLWEDRTRGSRWMPVYDATTLRLSDDHYERTRNTRVEDVGMRYFEFVALTPGRHDVVFESRYGWKFASEERKVCTIEVAA